MIYFDNAATTAVLPRAKQAFLDALEIVGNPSSLHEAGVTAAELLEHSRDTIAVHIGCYSHELYFTSGATESCAWGVKCLFEQCYRVDMGEYEHKAVALPYHHAPRNSFANKVGAIQMLANNETGEIYTIPKGNVLRFVDATAAVGYIPVDFHKLGCDYMAFTSHKIGGIAGIGAFVARGKVSPLFVGGEQEQGKRAGTESVALAAAFAAAISYKHNIPHITAMRDYLIEQLMQIDGAHLNGKWIKGDTTKRLPNNVNISFERINGQSLGLMLSDEGIMVSNGSACNSGNFEPSHVLLSMGVPPEIAKGTIRITLSDRNTMAECTYAVEQIKKDIEQLRRMA